MYLKIHATGQRFNNRFVIAVCDENLLKKTLEEGNLSLTVSEHFYKGEKRNEQEVVSILKDATNVNLIGEESVAAGIKAGIISEGNIIRILGVPHAQAVSF